MMVFDQGDLSLRWPLFRVVSRDGGLSSGFSLTAGSLAPPLAETNDQPGVTKKNQHEESGVEWAGGGRQLKEETDQELFNQSVGRL